MWVVRALRCVVNQLRVKDLLVHLVWTTASEQLLKLAGHRRHLIATLAHIATGRASVCALGPEMAAAGALGLGLFLLGQLLLCLLHLLVQLLHAVLVQIIPVIPKAKVIARVIQPDRKLFTRVGAHDPAHLLHMARQRLAKRSGTDPDLHIRNIKAARQDVGGNQPMNLRVGSGKVLDGLALELVVVLVADRYKVVSLAGKLLDQISAVRHASAEHNSLLRLAIDLVGLLDPLLDDVARDLHAALGDHILGPLAGYLLGPGHVDFFCDVHPQWCQPLVLHQPFVCGPADNVVVGVAQALGEWRSGQADDHHIRIGLDELGGLLPGYVALVHNQEIHLREVRAALQGLRATDLKALADVVLPVAGLIHAVR